MDKIIDGLTNIERENKKKRIKISDIVRHEKGRCKLKKVFSFKI